MGGLSRTGGAGECPPHPTRSHGSEISSERIAAELQFIRDLLAVADGAFECGFQLGLSKRPRRPAWMLLSSRASASPCGLCQQAHPISGSPPLGGALPR